MQNSFKELDEKINWFNFYSRYIKKYKKQNDELLGLCPFHEDSTASFTANLKTGKYNCFACGVNGNATTFLSKTLGIESNEAYKLLLKEAGLFQEPTTQKAKQPKYTVEEYCKEKQLSLSKITSCGLKNVGSCIAIPYYNCDGKEASMRLRFHPKSSKRFSWKKGSKTMLYGLWRLKDFTDNNLILVEGESDCHTLWQHGIQAIGVPGSSTFNPEWAEYLKGKDLYLNYEGGQGGDTFIRKTGEALFDAGFEGKVFKISCQAYGAKDPSDLHIKDNGAFTKHWAEIMQGAVPLDITKQQIEFPPMFPSAQVKLKTPSAWMANETGIFMFNAKSGEWELMCKTPIQINRRLRSVDSGEEKVEISFLRDRHWHNAIYPRSTIFTARSITALADIGVTVTSENAKHIVKFLGDLEAVNMDVIKKSDSVSQLGWHKNCFLPCMPGELTIDVDFASSRMIGAYKGKGELHEWVETMRQPRANNEILRFMIAASFAAPLLKILNHRNFFVHLWGDSKGGKTAALKAALSVWGDSEQLMTTFNATKVGLERLAGMYNDLPMGIDERQVVGNKQENVEVIVYMLSGGTSRVRGTKAGGIQAQRQWRTIALTTGEEPLSTEISQTGVSTRVLELYGIPFSNEADAEKMHSNVAQYFGTAGKAFIEQLVKIKADWLFENLKKIQEGLREKYPNKSMPHITSTAIVVLADMLVGEWLFNDEVAFDSSLSMGLNIVKGFEETKNADVIEKAREFIASWCMSNNAYFGGSDYTCYGTIDEDTYFIFPHIFSKVLTDAGYSEKKTKRGFAERGYIRIGKDGKFTIKKRMLGQLIRMIAFLIEIQNNADAINDDEEPF